MDSLTYALLQQRLKSELALPPSLPLRHRWEKKSLLILLSVFSPLHLMKNSKSDASGQDHWEIFNNAADSNYPDAARGDADKNGPESWE
jgi:hypothetical protein